MKRIIGLLMLSVPFFVGAQGFQINLQGQKQQGMGGAGTAFMQDGAAVFYNPGGVSFLKENTIDASVNAAIIKGTFVDQKVGSTTLGKKYNTDCPVVPPFSAYATYGDPKKKIRYGFGIYTPFGSDMTWENGWAGRYAITTMSLQTIFAQPTISYKINEKLGIGGGLVLGYGTLNLEKDLTPAIPGSHLKIDGSTTGIGFNAGVYYKATEKLSAGLTYRSQVKMKVGDANATFTGIPDATKPAFPNGEVSTQLTFPSTTTLGLSYTATQKLNLAFDVNYIGWESYDQLAFDFHTNTTNLKDSKSPRNYENTWAFRLGGQYQCNEKLTARLGASYSLTPIQDGYVSPEVPDSDRLNLTMGLGYKINKRVSVDMSFTYENMKRTGTNATGEAENPNPSAKINGKYDVKLFIPGVGISYTL